MTTKNTSLATAKTTNEIMGFQQTEIDIIKASVAKGTTDAELSYFLAVAKSTGLNPFQKEIWCYKSGSDMLIFAGRDGFLANAQKKNDFQGIRSAYVCENDTFKMNIPAGHIEHTFDGKERGKITGAYAIVKRANMDSFISYAGMTEFNKGYNAWKTNPGSMIKKVAESHCLAKAYGISGLAAEEDFEIKDNVAYVADHEERPTVNAIGFADELLRKSTLDEDTKCIIENKLCDQTLTNSELEKIVSDLKENQPAKY